MIKSVTGPGDRDGGPSATARAEEARNLATGCRGDAT